MVKSVKFLEQKIYDNLQLDVILCKFENFKRLKTKFNFHSENKCLKTK